MDEKKPPADILDEIMSRSEQPLPSPVSYPPKSDPPPPEDSPPPAPAAEKPPLAERLLPWLGILLGGAVLAALVLGFQLFSVNARLDGLQAAVGEIKAADTLLNEKKLLQRDMDTLQNQVESLEEQLDSVYEQWRASMQDTRLELRLRQSEYLYYMERFAASGDLAMAALVITLEDGVLRPPGEDEPERIPNGGTAAPPLNSVQQERYDEVRRVLEEKGVLYSSGMAKQNGTTPLWPSGTGPSENPETAALGILWCALDEYYVQRGQDAATQFLVETPLSNPDTGWPELLRNGVSKSTYSLYEGLLSELISAGCLQRAPNGAMGWNPGYDHLDIYYPLPFTLPGQTNR